MAKTYNRLEIDVNKKPNSIGIRPVQHDTKSRYLDVCLYENGVAINLTGEQVRITFRKADGSTFFNQGEVTDATAGRCQFALTNEILSEAKAVETQISVWNVGGQILSTQVFEIYVTAAIPWTDSVESENEYGVLVVLFQEIQDALDTMHKIATTFGEPGDKAAEYGVDTFWGILETLAQRGDVGAALKEYIKTAINSTFETAYFKPLDKLLSAKAGTAGFKPMDEYIYSLLTTKTTVAVGSEEDIGEPVSLTTSNTYFSATNEWEDIVSFVAKETGIYIFCVSIYNNDYATWRIQVDGVQKDTNTNVPYATIAITKGQSIKIQGMRTNSNKSVYIYPIWYRCVKNGLIAKSVYSSYSGSTEKIGAFTPSQSGIAMLIFKNKPKYLYINDTLLSAEYYTHGSEYQYEFYVTYIHVTAGKPVDIRISCDASLCVVSMREQIDTVSSFVKSIQRGSYYGTIGSGLTTFTIPIGAVNQARTYIDLPDYLYNGITIVDAKVVEDKLEVSCDATESRAVYFRWQLVEFS